MSSIVLKRKYEMQLPINYVEVEKEEMQYIDGGANWFTDWAMSVETVGAEINLAVAGLLGGGISWILARRVATVVGYKLLQMGIGIGGLEITGQVYSFLNDSNFGLSMAKWLDSMDQSPNNGIVWGLPN